MIELKNGAEELRAWWKWLRLDDVVLLIVGAFAALVTVDALVAGDFVVALASAAATVLSYANASANALARRQRAHDADEEGASK
ncbi:hypothetical protein BRD02_01540 [Halobacteriales archaeon QS_8_69_73]|nr:MAG: hypothetical protein BRD02_01540 [Halobacteriales archaeon QS_8_69_73]